LTAGAKLKVKVAPGASGDKVVGWLGDALKVRVSAPPEKGRANAAVIALLAKILKTPERNISVCSGQTSKNKVLKIYGMSDSELQRSINAFVD
jgi:uncharacterized protein (TIGR00251 family)